MNRRRRRRAPGALVLRVDTVLDIGREEWPVETVAELDAQLDGLAAEIADYRVRPVEVILCDIGDGPALFIGLGGAVSHAVYLSGKGNQFCSVDPGPDVGRRSLDAWSPDSSFLTER